MSESFKEPALDKAEHLALLKQALEASLSARAEHDKLRLLDSLIKDSVRYALRKQIRTLGKELYRLLGSTDAMGDVAEEVSAKDFQYRINIIDKAWDGTGDWYA